MRKIAIIVVAVVAVLAIALASGAYYLVGTPVYSLYLVRRAVQDGDAETFYHHFDVSLVTQNAIQGMVSELPAPARVFAAQASDMLTPAVEGMIRKKLDEKLRDPDKSSVRRMAYESVRYEDTTAHVTLTNQDDGSTTVITLVQMPDRRWKIVGLDLAKNGVGLQLPPLAPEHASTEGSTPRMPTRPDRPLLRVPRRQ